MVKETKEAYIQALIDSRESKDSTIIQDIMITQHIANVNRRIIQYIDNTTDDTVNNTVNGSDMDSQLLTLIKEHPEYYL